jgi:hypothetical protein
MRVVRLAQLLLTAVLCAAGAEEIRIAAVGGTLDSCTIPRRAPTLAEFKASYKGKAPFVFPTSGSPAARAALARSSLLASLGHLPVTLASSNSNSYAKRASTLAAYLEGHLAPVTLSDQADKLWYLFGDTLQTEEWAPLHATFEHRFDSEADEGLFAWGVGGRHSGVPFHRHGAVYAESILGRKRWWLSPPEAQPVFEGNETQFSYASRHAEAGEQGRVLACTLAAGEALYIPSQWWHATLNLDDYNAFVSSFVREL